jgi:hypothetical protein
MAPNLGLPLLGLLAVDLEGLLPIIGNTLGQLSSISQIGNAGYLNIAL